MYEKNNILLARTGVRKISYVAFVKIHYYVNRINEVYVFFNKISL